MEKKISKFFYIRRVLRGVLFRSKRKKNCVKREKACFPFTGARDESKAHFFLVRSLNGSEINWII